jgi:hypothetical protein
LITLIAVFAIPVLLGLLPGALGAILKPGMAAAVVAATWALITLIMSAQVPDDAVHIGPGIARLVVLGAVIGLVICAIVAWRQRNQGTSPQ